MTCTIFSLDAGKTGCLISGSYKYKYDHTYKVFFNILKNNRHGDENGSFVERLYVNTAERQSLRKGHTLLRKAFMCAASACSSVVHTRLRAGCWCEELQQKLCGFSAMISWGYIHHFTPLAL
ncbi:hypothetical protein RRG08_037888 [Elysia crispata]|uniref:Uncharacterized protein n=1 Tax=Elysia crispata TaxID=231223 RepID=A0AAE0ZL07_9GAST|nr:hypothetical protein RRG08_037888 [Elysia crispata]